eukprot:9482835-Alexandrium_andersonii.AAC.1
MGNCGAMGGWTGGGGSGTPKGMSAMSCMLERCPCCQCCCCSLWGGRVREAWNLRPGGGGQLGGRGVSARG